MNLFPIPGPVPFHSVQQPNFSMPAKESTKAAAKGGNLVTSGAAYAAIADAQSTIQTNINNLNSINWVVFE